MAMHPHHSSSPAQQTPQANPKQQQEKVTHVKKKEKKGLLNFELQCTLITVT